MLLLVERYDLAVLKTTIIIIIIIITVNERLNSSESFQVYMW